MEPNSGLNSVPLRLNVPSHGNAEGTHPYFLHHAYITGEFPVMQMVQGKGLYRTGPNFRGYKRIRECFSDGTYTCLIEGSGFMVNFSAQFNARAWYAQVYAKNRATAHRVARKFMTLDNDDHEIPTDHVETTFWHYSEVGGARNTVRQLYADDWDFISRNYPKATRSNLDRLVGLTPEEISGKIVLLHGPPGTGKTTFLVTLGKAWQKWCDIDIVIDPEMLFGVPDYMVTAFLKSNVSIFDDDDLEENPPERWRMIVLEDTDELISADAHAKSGQAMSRLLNLTDGMLGKGAKLILALTTNEDLSKLHPAITRPGRCLMNIEMPRFDTREAREWLGDSASVVHDMTLAELYELQAGADNNTAKNGASPGQYL